MNTTMLQVSELLYFIVEQAVAQGLIEHDHPMTLRYDNGYVINTSVGSVLEVWRTLAEGLTTPTKVH